MTIEVLNKYRSNSDWSALLNKLDSQLFVLKKLETDLIASNHFECPICAGPVSRDDKICPYCRSVIPEREGKGGWMKTQPTEEFMNATREAWALYSDLLHIQRKIDMESEANSSEEMLRKNIAEMQSKTLDIILDSSPEEVIAAARSYETYVADYFLGVVEERFSLPFDAIRRKDSSPDISAVMAEFKKITEEKKQ